ncbi:MAG TPA: hypothetical protein VKS03_08745 [Thermoanaerobaculia bacterium]|nr:hypothetical protein [Thermoanaerobaculia bacterium]
MNRFAVAKRADVSRGRSVTPKVNVVNAGSVAGTATIAVEGSLLDASGSKTHVYSATQDVTLAPGMTGRVAFPAFTPSTAGTLTWTATVADADPDQDVATAATKVVP